MFGEVIQCRLNPEKAYCHLLSATKNCKRRDTILSVFQLTYLGQSSAKEYDGRCMQHAQDRKGQRTVSVGKLQGKRQREKTIGGLTFHIIPLSMEGFHCLVCIVVVVLCVLLQLSCVYCCSCLACIVAVVLRVLLQSCVYCCGCLVCIVVILCVFAVLCVYCCFYFRCRTAGQKSVFGRSCDRPPRHRFFLVSLCLKANAEMVPNIPSCHYMLLMQLYRLKFISNQFHVLYTCKITTATG